MNLLSSVFRPSTVILIVVGGLRYSYNEINETAVLISVLLVITVYIFICLKAKQDTQLYAAKILTFVFAVVMAIAVVGIILKVSKL